MSEQTVQQEALYILSVIERGSTDAEFLGEARRKFYELMKARGYERRDYLDSVDACLALKLPDRCIWKLYHGDDRGASATILFRPAGQPALDWGFGRAVSLPLAMLKAWWSLQD